MAMGGGKEENRARQEEEYSVGEVGGTLTKTWADFACGQTKRN